VGSTVFICQAHRKFTQQVDPHTKFKQEYIYVIVEKTDNSERRDNGGGREREGEKEGEREKK
jgi:hypothetical protein